MLTTRLNKATSQEVERSKCVPALEQLTSDKPVLPKGSESQEGHSETTADSSLISCSLYTTGPHGCLSLAMETFGTREYDSGELTGLFSVSR